MEIKKTTMKVKGKDGWEIIHPETEVEQVVGLYETITSATGSVAEDVELLAGETDAKFQSIKRKPISDWAAGDEYGLKDICVYEDVIYQCIEANSDTEFDKEKWTAIGGGGLGLWDIVDGNAIIPKDITDMKPEDLGTDEATIRSIVESVMAESAMSVPVGTVLAWPSNLATPAGHLTCNGASLLRSEYPALFAAIGTTWGAVDDAHFNLPNMVGRFAEGAETAGSYKEAGLPNIEGSVSSNNNAIAAVTSATAANSGALLWKNFAGKVWGADGGSTVFAKEMSFDASRSSSIYGNSNTVQPASATVIYIIKAFEAVSASLSLIETTQIANSINDKQDRLPDNVDYVVEDYRDLEGNWYRKYKSGWVEQGGLTPASTALPVLTLLKPMQSDTYHALCIDLYNNIQGGGRSTTAQIVARTPTNITITQQSAATVRAFWRVEGQGAEV